MASLKKKIALLFVAAIFLMGAVTAFFLIDQSPSHGRVVIGAKNSTEQHLLSEMLAQLIESKTSLRVDRQFTLEGSTICFYALKTGSIDLYCEYTGTAWLYILNRPFDRNSGQMLSEIKTVFKERYGLLWQDPIGFNNTFVLVMQESLADRLHIATISALAEAINANSAFKIGICPEFAARPELKLLQANYPFKAALHPQMMDQALLYLTLAKNSLDVITACSTDSALFGSGLRVLEDDFNCFPPYFVSPVVREDTLARYPELRPVINQLAGRITDKMMQELNYKVEREKRSVEAVAKEFLSAQRML
ncbi:MAG: glycine/betaine ABC transporter substrate-binding protein [Verrucomicrobia bacterium]|nr:glycine/betaine ABC transporter substrate-binding protein [Verrucomicrobiota bacterium]